jgi:hypothetical protein
VKELDEQLMTISDLFNKFAHCISIGINSLSCFCWQICEEVSNVRSAAGNDASRWCVDVTLCRVIVYFVFVLAFSSYLPLAQSYGRCARTLSINAGHNDAALARRLWQFVTHSLFFLIIIILLRFRRSFHLETTFPHDD